MDELPPSPEQQELPRRSNTAFAIVVVLFIALGVAALVNRKAAVAPTVNTNISSGPFVVGDTVAVNFNTDTTNVSGLAAVAVDEESYSLFVDVSQDPNGSLDILIQDNKVFTVANGTTAKILESRSAASRIRITEGNELGKEGWVSNDFLYR